MSVEPFCDSSNATTSMVQCGRLGAHVQGAWSAYARVVGRAQRRGCVGRVDIAWAHARVGGRPMREKKCYVGGREKKWFM